MNSVLPRALWIACWQRCCRSPRCAVDVRDVRLWAGPDNTRVVLDLSGSAQHSLQVLQNPDRVVLDVAGARLAQAVRTPRRRAPAPSSRCAWRSSPSGELRIVLDLARPIQAKSFLSSAQCPLRISLVIDLGRRRAPRRHARSR